MLSFSKQISRGNNNNKEPRDDVSPTIKNRPRVEKLHTHLNSMNQDHIHHEPHTSSIM